MTHTAASRAQSFQRARRQIASRLPATVGGDYERGYRDAISAMLMQLQPAAVRTTDVEMAVARALDAICASADCKSKLGVFAAEQIGSVELLDIIGECDPSAGAAEWRWIEQRASFKSGSQAPSGSRSAVLDLASPALQLESDGGVPPLLLPVLREAVANGLAYLTFRVRG